MKKMLPLLFASLLALGSCSKSNDDPQPAAKTTGTVTLLAKWQQDSVWVTDGTVAGESRKDRLQVFRPSLSTEFTATHYITYNGTAVYSQEPYTQSGNALLFAGGGILNKEIRVLTANRMLLASTRDAFPATSIARLYIAYHR